MHQPTLSVIVPNYNHSFFLPQVLEDILTQSFRPIEVIVIDDGSTDNSVEIIEGFVKKDPVVRLVRNEQNRGVLFTGKRGIELATGDYIYFAAADDLILPGLFEKSMSLLDKYPHAGLCSAMVESLEPDGTRIPAPLEDISSKECFLSPAECIRLLRRRDSWMGGTSTIFRRRAFIEAGAFIPELGPLCDIFVEMVIALKHGACFIPTRLGVQRLYATSYSASLSMEQNTKIYSHAVNLMKTTYKELFPPDYVSAWEERHMHLVRLSALKGHHRQEMMVIRSFFPHENLMDRLIIFVMNLSILVQFLAFGLYLFLRLGKEFRCVVTRVSRIAIRRIKQKIKLLIYQETQHL